MPTGLINGTAVFGSCPSANSQHLTTYDRVTPALNAIQRLGMTGPRFDLAPFLVEPTRGGTRNFANIDEYCNRLLSRGISYIFVGTYYGVTGTGWVTTNQKQPAPADHPYLRDTFYAIYDRLIANGFAQPYIYSLVWNEPDGPVGGGTSGDFHADVATWMEYITPLMRARYPNIKHVCPSFSWNLEASDTGIKASNIDAGFKTNVLAVQNMGISCYPKCGDMAVPYSSWEYRALVRRRIDAAIADFEALDASLIGDDMNIVELGLTQPGAGFTTSSWVKRGGEALVAEYRAHELTAAMEHPRVSLVSWFNIVNQAAGEDARSSDDGWGLLDYTNRKPYKNSYLALGRALGKPMVEADELAFWGSWAPEPA